MKLPKFACLPVAIAVLAFSSCKPSAKNDLEDPVIAIQQPLDSASVSLGANVQIIGVLSDDNDLASYNYRVEDSSGDLITGFEYDVSGIISGETYDLLAKINIPTTLTDTVFYIHYTVTDIAAKSASSKNIMIVQ